MFVDVARIFIKAGKGGDGAVSFHREKYIAAGGPDGGDGGKGGSVVFQVDDNLSTLLDFRMKRKYVAQNGANGTGKRSSGKDGENILIKVPRGTLIRDAETGALLQDMSGDEPFVAAKGGRGGWGNCHFATPTRQAPRFAKPGLPGEERMVTLELKLIADVGLIGFPNVGKSTLLSVISKARPKIADYHFTTLTPNLGVVYVGEGESFVAADIPGIIEGAAEGAGLGHDFLRHIERCRLLLHLVDVSGSEGRDPVEDLETINRELKEYSPALASRPQIIAANKTDIAPDGENARRLREKAQELGCAYFEISAAAQMGVQELVYALWQELEKLPPIEVYEAEIIPEKEADPEEDIIIRRENDTFYVTGRHIERIFASVNLSDYESRMYFERALRKAGLFEKLEEKGVKEHDTVNVCGFEFEYIH